MIFFQPIPGSPYFELHIVCPDVPGYELVSIITGPTESPAEFDCSKYTNNINEYMKCEKYKPETDCKVTCKYQELKCKDKKYEENGTCNVIPKGYPLSDDIFR